jgi:hypothetical protein
MLIKSVTTKLHRMLKLYSVYTRNDMADTHNSPRGNKGVFVSKGRREMA